MGNFVINENSFVKDVFPEFQTTMAVLEAKAKEDAQTHIWPGLDYGGYTPGADQYGRTTIPPWMFADENNDILDRQHSPTEWGYNSYRQLYTSSLPAAVTVPGWKQILEGAGTPQTLEDFILALAGYAFSSETINFTKIHQTIGDTNYAITDIEEANSYCQPVVIFEEGFRVPPETYFTLTGFCEVTGYQRVVPKGFALYRRKDLIIIE